MRNVDDLEVRDLLRRVRRLEETPTEPMELSPNWKRLLNEHLQVRLWATFVVITSVLAAGGWFVIHTAAREAARNAALSISEPEVVRRLKDDPDFNEKVRLDILESFKGGIVAFQSERCPDGWVPFEDGQGKFILGAGRGNLRREDGTSQELRRRELNAEGGYESVVLTDKHLPRHRHRISTSRDSEIHDGLGGSENRYGIDHNFSEAREVRGFGVLEGVLEPTGHTNPVLENMPPFIALTFCILEPMGRE